MFQFLYKKWAFVQFEFLSISSYFYLKKLRIIGVHSPLGSRGQGVATPREFTLELSRGRSRVILDSDPQFLPLSLRRFLRFLSQKTARNFLRHCAGKKCGENSLFFVEISEFGLLRRVAAPIDSDFLWQIAAGQVEINKR